MSETPMDEIRKAVEEEKQIKLDLAEKKFKQSKSYEQLQKTINENTLCDNICESEIIKDEDVTPNAEIKKEQTALAVTKGDEPKSITDISLDNVKMTLNTSKSYEEQAEDVVGVMSTVRAINDEGTQNTLATAKQSELIDKAKTKVKHAQKSVIEADTEIQKSEREAYEGILETFGFFRHYPHWMMKAIVYGLTPFFLLIGFIVGIPCGAIKILIDNIDGIIVRYQKAEDTSKPKIKISILVLLILTVVLAISLTTLKCLHII